MSETGFLALFDGNIKGEVRNPLTGKVYQRRQIMDFYRSLMSKACEKPVDRRSLEMLEMVRMFLDVPSDIHLALLMEVRDNRPDTRPPSDHGLILEDMDASLDRWMAQHIAHQSLVRDLFEEFKEGAVENKPRSRSDGIMDQMLEGEDDGAGISLNYFQKRYIKP